MGEINHHDKTEHFPHDDSCPHHDDEMGVRLALVSENPDTWRCPECNVTATETAALEFEVIDVNEYDPNSPDPNEPLPDSLNVIVGGDFIAIADDGGYEVVHWHQDEWTANPDLTTTIADACRQACENPGAIIRQLYGPGDWPNERQQRAEPAWADHV